MTRNGVLKSDFPIDGGVFARDQWKEKKLPSDVSKSVVMLPQVETDHQAYPS